MSLLQNPNMHEHPQNAGGEERPVDPYGDVALGVECAWPESIPVSDSSEPAAA